MLEDMHKIQEHTKEGGGEGGEGGGGGRGRRELHVWFLSGH